MPITIVTNPPAWIPPTPEELRQYIESQPDLADLWSTVFKVPTEPEPTADTSANWFAEASAWRVKVKRAGRLEPDAAHEIAARLTAAGVQGVTMALVQEAHRDGYR